MWPRTPEERSRNRNTGELLKRQSSQEVGVVVPHDIRISGFVCFMNREDAEEAMDNVAETDPFNVGRLLMLRWGKNVKKTVRQGTGGGISMSKQRAQITGNDMTTKSEEFPSQDSIGEYTSSSEERPVRFVEMASNRGATDMSRAPKYDKDGKFSNNSSASALMQNFCLLCSQIFLCYKHEVHSRGAIQVTIPQDPVRYNFISTVAAFVAKDGSMLEKRLMEAECGNPLFNFLTLDDASPGQHEEHLFYRWRVYSFCQGDRFSSWSTEPFLMFHPHGRYYIPPPINKEAAIREEDNRRKRDRLSQSLRNDRTRAHSSESSRRNVTGRQLEKARTARRKGEKGQNTDGREKLSVEDLNQFNILVKNNLSLSRHTICEAMAFCFEKSAAAKEISSLLGKAIQEEDPTVTLDMTIARLFLLSDILFNSQQTGVKNAFIYRSQIEKMAPAIFTNLGRYGGGRTGRMTMNKLRTAVSSVLGAWTEWSVYDPTFIDDLDARFDNREIKKASGPSGITAHENATAHVTKESQTQSSECPQSIINDRPCGNWKEVADDLDDDDNMDGDSVKEDPDGESISADEGIQESLLQEATQDQPSQQEEIDGDPIQEEDIDGYPIQEEDIDGEEVEEFDEEGLSNLDENETSREDALVMPPPRSYGAREKIAMSSSSGILGSNQLLEDQVEGEAVDEQQLVRETVGEDELDGEALDGEDIDGEPF
jgi:hypothetical protein